METILYGKLFVGVIEDLQMGRLSCIALQAPLVHGILQARILEWVAIPDLPDPGMEPKSPVPQAVSLQLEPPWKSWTTWVGLECNHVYP